MVICSDMSLLSSGVDSPLHRAATAFWEAPGGYGGAVHFPEAIWGEVSAGQGFYHWEWDLPGRSCGHCGIDASECWSMLRKCQHKGEQMLLGREDAACGNTSVEGEARAYLSRTGLRQWGECGSGFRTAVKIIKKAGCNRSLLFLISSNTSSSFFIMTFIFNLQRRR